MIAAKLAVLGVGLIGGSLARALKKAGAVGTVSGYGRSVDSLEQALRLGAIDDYHLELGAAVNGADLVVLAAPLSVSDELLSQLPGAISSRTVITDVGSAKGRVVARARADLGIHFSRFVPGHPIAGREASGVQASCADLFAAHRVILTPQDDTAADALELITRMWRLTGAEVVTLPVEHHDTVLANTSHLPHMLAYALVDCLAGAHEREEVFAFAAGGFADFTRIASSDPVMWHDICLANRKRLLEAMEQFDRHLGTVRRAIVEEDSDALLGIFTRAKRARDSFARQRSAANDAPE